MFTPFYQASWLRQVPRPVSYPNERQKHTYLYCTYLAHLIFNSISHIYCTVLVIHIIYLYQFHIRHPKPYAPPLFSSRFLGSFEAGRWILKLKTGVTALTETKAGRGLSGLRCRAKAYACARISGTETRA